MNELINITLNENQEPVTTARKLHEALGISQRFSRWVENNFVLFTEGQDYNKCTLVTVVNNGAKRELEDYTISLMMAKHLSMMTRTPKGFEVRDYFIQVEKDFNSPEKIMARPC